jgi:hypothetical protein
MSTGSGLSGGAPGAGDEPPKTEAGPAARHGDDGTFADVLNGFSLDSGRGRRKRKKDTDSKKSPEETGPEEEGPEETGPAENGSEFPGIRELPEFQEGTAARADGSSPPTDPGDRVTSVVSPPASTDRLGPTAGGLFDPGPTDSGYSSYPTFGGPSFNGSPYGRPSFGDQSFDGGRISTDRHLGDDSPDRGEDTAIVRPYALTGGRTKSNYALELETLVSTRTNAEGAISEAVVEQIESLSIMEECRNPRSVAEIAAILRVPLGVARVLISDAADAGLVTVHKTISGNDGAEAHLVLMERVLSGLRRL